MMKKLLALLVLSYATFVSAYRFVPQQHLFSTVNAVPDSAAILQINSTTQGMLPPRMTTTQRDAISTPPQGLQIYNTTTNDLENYDGSSWVSVGGIGGSGSSTDNAVARWDGATGTLLQDSSVILDDSDAFTGITSLTVDNLVLNGNTLSSSSGNLVLDPTSGLNLPDLTIDRAVYVDGSGNLVSEANVDSTELGYLNGVTSGIQTQLDAITTLADGTFYLGNGSNVATEVTMSGDITMTNAGVTSIGTGKVTSDDILDGDIVNVDVNASAAIDYSKLAALTSANILVGNGSNVATSVAMSGDVTITNAGVTSIGTGKVTSDDILDGEIVDADVNASAAIADSKISFSGDLAALEAISTTGMMARTAADTYVMRTITGTTNEVDLSNGDGVSGNPTIGLADNPVIPGTGETSFATTTALQLPSGTTAQRPGSPTAGDVRWNSTISSYEGYNGSSWAPIGGGGPQFDKVFDEQKADQKDTSDFSTGSNAAVMGGGTITAGIFSENTDASDLMDADDSSVFSITGAAGDESNDYICSEAITIPQAWQDNGSGKQDILHRFQYKSFFTTDVDIQVRGYCVGDTTEVQALNWTPILKDTDLAHNGGDADDAIDADEGDTFDVVFQYDDTCDTIRWCLHIQGDIATSDEIMFNNIITGVMPVNRVETVGQTETYRMGNTGNFWDAATDISTFDITLLPLTGSELIEYDDTTQTRVVAKKRIKLHFSLTSQQDQDSWITAYHSDGTDIASSHGGDTDDGRVANISADIILEKDEYIYFRSQNPYSAREARLVLTATPLTNKAIAVTGSNPNTDWQSFTPTGDFTNTTYAGKWRREGPDMIVRYHLEMTGTPAAANIIVDLPSVCGSDGATACTIDTAKLPDTDTYRYMLGDAKLNNNGSASNIIGTIFMNSTTELRVNPLRQQGATEVDSQGGDNTTPFTFVSGDEIHITARFPVTGWSVATNVNYMLPTINVGGAEHYYIANQSNFWDATGDEDNWDYSLLTGDDYTASKLIEIDETTDSTETRIKAKRRIRITGSIGGAVESAGNNVQVRRNDDLVGLAEAAAAYDYKQATINVVLKTGEYIYFKNSDVRASDKAGNLNFIVVPDDGPTSHAHIIAQPECMVNAGATNYLDNSVTYSTTYSTSKRYLIDNLESASECGDKGANVTINASTETFTLQPGYYKVTGLIGANPGVGWVSAKLYSDTDSADVSGQEKLNVYYAIDEVTATPVHWYINVGKETEYSIWFKTGNATGSVYFGPLTILRKR